MVKLGVGNFLLIGVMAVLFIVIIKVVLTKYPVKGLSDVVQAV
jgi:hypothetical protein